MTEIRDNAPSQDRASIGSASLEGEGIKIELKEACLTHTNIYRSINSSPWVKIGENVRFPFIDNESFSRPSHIAYQIEQLPVDGDVKKYVLEVILPEHRS